MLRVGLVAENVRGKEEARGVQLVLGVGCQGMGLSADSPVGWQLHFLGWF